MNADAKALLAAIVANPVDDTVRLAFADCIEEQGNAPRAQFIRLQIEAERHHPHSAKHAALTEQAGALFAEHWIEWWTEVCEAVGLPLPEPKPAGRLGRLAGRMRLRAKAGSPYDASGSRRELQLLPPYRHFGIHRFAELAASAFRRGFPEMVALWRDAENSSLLTRWPMVSPIVELRPGYWADDERVWIDGPHLNSVRRIDLSFFPASIVQTRCETPYLAHVEELILNLQERAQPVEPILAAFRSWKLKSLTFCGGSLATATAVAEAAHLSNLETLCVADEQLAPGVISILSRSASLSGLRKLDVDHLGSGEDYQSLTTGATWTKLRILRVEEMLGSLSADDLEGLLSNPTLPELEELRLGWIPLTRQTLEILIRSPLLKQLKHCEFCAHDLDAVSDADIRRIPEAFDLDRLETLVFRYNVGYWRPRRRPMEYLKQQLGERLRLHALPRRR